MKLTAPMKKTEKLMFNDGDEVEHTLYGYTGKVISSDRVITIVDSGHFTMIASTSALIKIIKT